MVCPQWNYIATAFCPYKSFLTPRMIHQIKFCWTEGPRRRRRKKVIQCDDVTSELYTPQSNGNKNVCNYNRWHVSPSYNDVYHNWRRLCSNSMKSPRSPTHLAPLLTTSLYTQAGGAWASPNISRLTSLCRLYRELSCQIILTGRYRKLCVMWECVFVCETTAHTQQMLFFKGKVHVDTLIHTNACTNTAENGVWVTTCKCQQCVPRQRVVINSINSTDEKDSDWAGSLITH